MSNTDPDSYEHAEIVNSPLGKYYKVEVPDWKNGMSSYLRLGAVDPVTDAGEDLAGLVNGFTDDTRKRDDVSPPVADPPGQATRPAGTTSAATGDPRVAESAVLHTKGGWRDHSDGNRITTTRGDKVEVIRGNYKLLVLGRHDPVKQHGVLENGTVYESSGGHVDDADVDDKAAALEISYSWDLDAVNPKKKRWTKTVTEGKRPTATEDERGNFSETIWSHDRGDRVYADRYMGVTSTCVNADGTGWWGKVANDDDGAGQDNWEQDVADLEVGEMREYFIGRRVIEVIRGKDFMRETLKCDDGDFELYLLAGKKFLEIIDGETIEERTRATKTIDNTMHADLSISEITTAGGAIVDVTAAGGTITEVSAAGTKFDFSTGALLQLELKTAIGALIDIAASIFKVQLDFHALSFEYSTGVKFEFHNLHKVIAVDKTEVNAALRNVAADVTAIQGSFKKLAATEFHAAGNYTIA